MAGVFEKGESPVGYSIIRKVLLNRIFRGKGFWLSRESQTKIALPTMWSCGTNPQKRESAELCLLSPTIQK